MNNLLRINDSDERVTVINRKESTLKNIALKYFTILVFALTLYGCSLPSKFEVFNNTPHKLQLNFNMKGDGEVESFEIHAHSSITIENLIDYAKSI